RAVPGLADEPVLDSGAGLERDGARAGPRAVDPAAGGGRGDGAAHGVAAVGRGPGRGPGAGRQQPPKAGSQDPMNSEVRYHRRRLADTAAALRMARTQVRREQGPRAQLASHQQQRLETVVRHAASHSPFYRRWFAETGALGEEPVQLQRLPVLDRSCSWSTSTSWSVTPGCTATSCWTGPAS